MSPLGLSIKIFHAETNNSFMWISDSCPFLYKAALGPFSNQHYRTNRLKPYNTTVPTVGIYREVLAPLTFNIPKVPHNTNKLTDGGHVVTKTCRKIQMSLTHVNENDVRIETTLPWTKLSFAKKRWKDHQYQLNQNQDDNS
jgi:hypothetical protein